MDGQYARYSDLEVLVAIRAWVDRLRAKGCIKPSVRFAIEEDEGQPVGVLFDPDETLGRWSVLRPNRFLVHTGDTLEVLDPATFHSRYRDTACA